MRKRVANSCLKLLGRVSSRFWCKSIVSLCGVEWECRGTLSNRYSDEKFENWGQDVKWDETEEQVLKDEVDLFCVWMLKVIRIRVGSVVFEMESWLKGESYRVLRLGGWLGLLREVAWRVGLKSAWTGCSTYYFEWTCSRYCKLIESYATIGTYDVY